MSDKILLSKEHGLNACIVICSQCGKETGEILLAGKTNKYKCAHCGIIIFGSTHRDTCPKCNSSNIILIERDACTDRTMTFGLCKECEAIRKSLRIMPPEPCGVEFSKQNCPTCRKQVEMKNNS